MKGWRRRSNARYTPKVHALSPVVCRRAEGLRDAWGTAGRLKRNVACAAYLRKDTVFFPARQLFPPRIFARRKA